MGIPSIIKFSTSNIAYLSFRLVHSTSVISSYSESCWMRDLLWPTRRYVTRGLFIISCPAFARQNNCLTFPYFQIYLSYLESLRFKLNLWWEGSLLLLHKKRCLWREAVRDYRTFSKNKKEHSPLFGVAFVSVFRQTSKFMILVFLEARGKPFSSRKLLVKFSK